MRRAFDTRYSCRDRWAPLCWLISAAFGLICGCAAGNRAVAPNGATPTSRPAGPSTTPYFEYRSHPVEYLGPGRDDPEPEDVHEVKIGWFGPTDPKDPIAGPMWSAAALAVEEANRDGGYRGRPFRLVGAWSASPWGSGVADVTRLVYEQGVWAILGGPDGPSAHLVEQVIAKARVPFISPVSTDKTTNLVNIPWIFSCAPADHLLVPVLAGAIASRSGSNGFVVVGCTDHDSRVAVTELLTALRRWKAAPKRMIDVLPDSGDFAAQLRAIRESAPAAVVVIAGPGDSARFLAAMRREGTALAVFGGPAMGRRAFLDAAGKEAEGVVFPQLWDPPVAGERARLFVQHFRQRFATEPDYTAAYTCDAANLLIAAVRQAGLNRSRIADAVRGLSGWAGVTGTITWDPTGQNNRAVVLGTIREGHVRPIQTSEAAAPLSSRFEY